MAHDGWVDGIWQGDACGLVQAYRDRVAHPVEVTESVVAAIERSALDAVCHLDADAALAAAVDADVSRPFGGVPMGIKELEAVAEWPATEASLVLAGAVADHDSTQVARLRVAGAVLVAQTTASEFGGVNYTSTKLHGTTRNPWDPVRTPGGSSGGSAAAVAGGVLPIASGSDGGGSIRIPASFTGLLGVKPTFGRIPKGPESEIEPLTSVVGCMARSVRDSARWLDVCNGADESDPFSLPATGGWEAGLGTIELAGLRVAVAPDLGCAVIAQRVRALVEEASSLLIAQTGLRRVELDVHLPQGGLEWAMAGTTTLLAGLGDRYPACTEQLTPEIALSAAVTTQGFNVQSAISIELFRRRSIAAMAAIFDRVDCIIAATTPDVAFAAEGPMPTVVDGVDLLSQVGFERALGNNGALTIPANTTGNPAVSIPIGSIDGMPIGMQVIARHHAEDLLFDLALACERERPWPLTAPGAPH